ncbi:hypothetical protein TVAG_204880 [Trichomonas vaginalis G3]|uniref:Uncharacterized protein n=1 Tax=Trichomonas vaginalis (strain ATCC PRA-98 / G3) TaxID=412133 RepID=A2EIZ1_TRIV3|nr:hypothetical protein TVAGG3_0661650 [Trichomonas vaginalis G3]EAY07381.1 hypothetical protein TVAG_204880 [Trichomonas vaginalis G3]KAI5506534.1 hypothetical protein TVAGG3_0661650 [Trichomonas vaginalis G3]|eukprot:XP_001319604.1 hypothetical protein [Trichomonas vaginalis G3]
MEEEDLLDLSKLRGKLLKEAQTLEVFKPYGRVSNLLLLTPQEDFDLEIIFSELKNLIDSKAIPLEFVKYALEKASEIQEKKMKNFAELYVKLTESFEFEVNVRTDKFKALLENLGIKFDCNIYEDAEALKTVYSEDTPFYLVAFDKIDELSKLDKFDEIKNNLSLLDTAVWIREMLQILKT